MLSTLIFMTASLALPAAGDVQAPNIAVVNVSTASEKYARTGVLEGQFEVMRQKFAEQRDQRSSEIERLSRALEEQFKPGSADYKERREQLMLLQSRFEGFMEEEGRKLDASYARSLKSIFDDIRLIVAQIAEERGYDVVLTHEELPDNLPESSNVLRQQILFQKVLYASSRVDITEEVVNRLNSAYKPSRDSASGGAAAPADQTQAGSADPSRELVAD